MNFSETGVSVMSGTLQISEISVKKEICKKPTPDRRILFDSWPRLSDNDFSMFCI
jgi:hypothetical protein